VVVVDSATVVVVDSAGSSEEGRHALTKSVRAATIQTEINEPCLDTFLIILFPFSILVSLETNERLRPYPGSWE